MIIGALQVCETDLKKHFIKFWLHFLTVVIIFSFKGTRVCQYHKGESIIYSTPGFDLFSSINMINTSVIISSNT